MGEWKESIEVNFPPFAVVYDHSGRVIVCGGGGASKTGVPNKLIILEAARSDELREERRKDGEGNVAVSTSVGSKRHGARVALLRKVCVYDTGSDAIMNMALHPRENLLACGVGDHCRVYNVGFRNFQPIGQVRTDFAESEEDRGQKRARFSPCGNFLFCSGGDGYVRMFAFPSLHLVKTFNGHALEKEKETIDLSVTRNMMVTLSRKRCLVYDIRSGSLLHSFEPSDKKLSFRDARFCPMSTGLMEELDESEQEVVEPPSSADSIDDGLYDDRLETTSLKESEGPLDMRTNSPQSLRSPENNQTESLPPNYVFTPDSDYLYTTEFIPKQNAVIKKWDLRTWKCVKSKTIRFNSDHLTAFGVSPDGSTLAIGTVEGQLRVLDAITFSEVYKDVSKHEFFVTDFAFESSSSHTSSSDISSSNTLAKHDKRMLFSTSGDNTLRGTLIPNLSGTRRGARSACASCMLIIVLLLLLLLANMFVGVVYVHHTQPRELIPVWEAIGNFGYDPTPIISVLNQASNTSLELLSKIM